MQLNIKGDDDLVINGEADQIDSAVTKLIENAIGYSKENGVVSVSASKDKDGDRAVIRVIDQARASLRRTRRASSSGSTGAWNRAIARRMAWA